MACWVLVGFLLFNFSTALSVGFGESQATAKDQNGHEVSTVMADDGHGLPASEGLPKAEEKEEESLAETGTQTKFSGTVVRHGEDFSSVRPELIQHIFHLAIAEVLSLTPKYVLFGSLRIFTV